MRLPVLPEGGWTYVVSRTIATTAAVTVLAVFGSVWMTATFSGPVQMLDITMPIALAIILTVPIVGLLTIKLQQLSMANQRLHLYATTDGLTGVLNRRAFSHAVEAHLHSRAKSTRYAPGMMLVVDVDNFKRINDQFGHDYGDDALQRIVRAMRECLRENDLIGRLGGEEFGIFLSDMQATEADIVAERIRERVSAIHFSPEGHPHELTICIGISAPIRTLRFTDLYRDGDAKLYLAKANGRNRVEGKTDSPPPKGNRRVRRRSGPVAA